MQYQDTERTPEGRRAPEGMPTQVPPRRPAAPPPAREALPTQRPVTDEPAPSAPRKWKKIVKRILAALGLTLSLAMVYVFLLVGEPEEDSQLTQQTAAQEETIRVPIAASQLAGNADVTPLAASFGMPVLVLGGSPLTMTQATLFDTAFRGNYARRLTLAYAFDTGETVTLESIRPTAALALLAGGSNTLNMQSLYTVAGMDVVRVDGDGRIMLLARGLDAAYAIIGPLEKANEVLALLKQATLMQPGA